LAKVRPNPFQPRRRFAAAELQELVQSVKERGIMQPVLVRRKGDAWELIAGERRFRAAQKLGHLTLPAVEVTASDVDALEIALVENLQRTDLDPLEEAEGYRRLQEEFHLTQEQVATKVGKDRATVANAIRLLKLGPEVQEMLVAGRITAGHARVLAGLPNPRDQKRLADRIVLQGLSVRDAENILAGVKGSGKSRKTTRPPDPNVSRLEAQLREFFETKVTVRSSGRNKGAVVVEYYSLEELERILDRLRRGGFRP
jgi:ParB family chromosome partitioning protein